LEIHVAQRNALIIGGVVVAAAVVAAVAWFGFGGSRAPAPMASTAGPAPAAPTGAPASSSPAASPAPTAATGGVAEMAMGPADAKVTVVEYMSLTCPHCAAFHRDVLPQLKTNYVDTNKIRFVFRDFPLDGVAYGAAIIARCMGEENPARYVGFVDILFRQQERWARSPEPLGEVKRMAQVAGMSGETFDACLKNEKVATTILQMRQEAVDKYKISATPSFLVNGRLLEGGQSLAEFEKVLTPLLN
jgi:protein-disulfide isomerase